MRRVYAVVVALVLGSVGALLSSQAFTSEKDVHIDWVDAEPGRPATVEGRSLVIERVAFAKAAVRDGDDEAEPAGNVFLVLEYRAWSEREEGYLDSPVLRTADGTVYTPVGVAGASTAVTFPAPGFTEYGQLLFDVHQDHLEGARLVDDPSTGFIVYEARRRIDLRLDRSAVRLPEIRPEVVVVRPRTEVTS
jgi:hypothetical protein